MAKLTTWTLRNAVPTVHPKASKVEDVALTVTADSIVKNGKAADGKVINLTVAHIRSEGFSFSYNEETREATIKRSEGSRGRKPRAATPTNELNAFMALLTAPANS